MLFNKSLERKKIKEESDRLFTELLEGGEVEISTLYYGYFWINSLI